MKRLVVFILLAVIVPTHTRAAEQCTMEAKLCPDGSAVGRVGPNCEFAPCPDVTTPNDKQENYRSQQTQQNRLIDYESFLMISKEAYALRQQRLIDERTFINMSLDKNTIILDTRSQEMYSLKHIKGAKHLNFSNFTQAKLAKIIPSKTTRILIYCNNNFIQDSEAFANKAPPLALNIPTFINLYGYGYKNIYELGEAIDEENTSLRFESFKK
jgi:hypothetical protein